MSNDQFRDAQGRTMAQRSLDQGATYPYDAPDARWNSEDLMPFPARDWAHAAARGILHDLGDRGGIKRGFERIDENTRADIVEALAAIIREAAVREGRAA